MKRTNNINKLGTFGANEIRNNLKQVINNYMQNGVIILEDYLSESEVNDMLKEIEQIQYDAEQDIAANWCNNSVYFYSKNPAVKETDDNEYVTEPYFQSSRNKAHIFYEQINNVKVVNRIGHGMHLHAQYQMMHNAVYNHAMLTEMLQGIGLKQPVCHLSVYIPKYPNGEGSKVRPHQESTFAYTNPNSVVVLWLALEDALIENACMYGIMGSNHWPLKWVSQINHKARTRQFVQLSDIHIPDFIAEHKQYTPLEVKAGDALLFHGNFVHCSPVNNSSFSRKALSFQFIETLGTDYPETNWLQPPNRKYLYNSSPL